MKHFLSYKDFRSCTYNTYLCKYTRNLYLLNYNLLTNFLKLCKNQVE